MANFTETLKVKIEDAPGSKYGRKMVPYDDQAFRWMLLHFNPGEDALFGIKRYREKHSPSQRGYLRGVVVPAILRAMPMEESKENNDALYLKLKEKFGPCEMKYGKDGEKGEVLAFPKSARDMDTMEMSQLIDGSIRWAEEFLGITIPPPDRTMTSGMGI